MPASTLAGFDVGYLSSLPDRLLGGVREPHASYQRSRQADFPSSKTFFDWYYFFVRDVQTERAWAFTYAMSRCDDSSARPCLYSGAWPGFVEMRRGVPARQYVERFGLDAWSASSRGQNASIVGSRSRLAVAASENGSSIHLTGLMASPDKAWRAEGGLGSQPISWDLRIRRRAGWFGESYIESPFHLGRATGAIMWSPYGHQSTVEGTLQVGNETITLGGDDGRYRAYCDSNWGETMPRPPSGADPFDYPWGWYYAAQPHADPAQDVSIICGAGRTDMKFAGVVFGKLCDMRIGDRLRLSLWSWTFENHGNRTTSWVSDHGLGLQGVETFNISRSKWVDWKDAYGEARVPMAQQILIVTKKHRITMDFDTNSNATSRLLFPLQDELFSDFEALGATAAVKIVEVDTGTVVADFTDTMGGLEYGYNVPTKLPPRSATAAAAAAAR